MVTEMECHHDSRDRGEGAREQGQVCWPQPLSPSALLLGGSGAAMMVGTVGMEQGGKARIHRKAEQEGTSGSHLVQTSPVQSRIIPI